MIKKANFVILVLLSLAMAHAVAQETPTHRWIQPAYVHSAAIWGIENGLVFSLWPYGLENSNEQPFGGGPRGLIRVGYHYEGKTYMMNFLAIEPVVDGQMEFSEISPSAVDGHWGKLFWASDDADAGGYYPTAQARGVVRQVTDGDNPVEELAVYVFMERFANGAAPYLKLFIRSDRPEELGVQVFDHEEGEPMDRCAITATMGNYPRIRNLHLQDAVINANELYAGFEGIHFIEKESYPMNRMIDDKKGSLWVLASGDESMEQLAAWPDDPLAHARSNWKYRAPVKFTQYWRKEKQEADPSLRVRVNGRARYWAGGSHDVSRYMAIPGGPSFENFELREKYTPGQQFYYGISLKTPDELID